MSATAAASGTSRARMNIGEVLDRLRPEFPGITIPKIRFLEDKGLIKPERTPAGYRKFSVEDVDRLRYVLLMQRDHYLPLKVIGEHLDAIDRGLEHLAVAVGHRGDVVSGSERLGPRPIAGRDPGDFDAVELGRRVHECPWCDARRSENAESNRCGCHAVV